MNPLQWSATEWQTIGAGIAMLFLGFGGAYAAKGSSKGKAEKTAVHQPVVRPETAAEMDQAASLERIAKAAESIERNLDVYLRSSR